MESQTVLVGPAVKIDDINQLASLNINGTYLQFSIYPDMITHPRFCSTLKVPLQKSLKNQGHLIYHGKYIYNFCHPEVPNQIDALVQEIQLAEQLGCHIIIHQGKNVVEEKMTKLEAINNYVRNISEVLEQTSSIKNIDSNGGSPPMIWLENSAGQGTELGFTLSELSYIFNQFDDTSRERLGFCLDTCHAFVAGELNLRQIGSTIRFFEEFDQLIGLDHLHCLHLNDSGAPFGTRRDLHGDLMGGYITNPQLGGNSEGMQWLVKMATQRQIPLIFETPCLFPGQYERQFDIVQRWSQDQEVNPTSYREIQEAGYKYYQSKRTKKRI